MSDGSVALHTRSTKYGKLAGGQLLTVPANLVKRQKQHFVSMTAIGERESASEAEDLQGRCCTGGVDGGERAAADSACQLGEAAEGSTFSSGLQ